ncbi:DEAD/DEAH box helicase [Hyphomicrobium sp.]|uniref:DEAD/DEAH box helicase n=1 Tax=Hyphomicrobium sp. TaxID=82 RepID=UPI001D60A813|nr:SNF2-related protein [Hyphomicrobium sp.]MBY0560125.1 DEAD/DEAH box helicase [Hyphomicrobium sp.]
MPPQPHQVQTKPLRRSKDPAEFDVYCAGLEWGLVDPIIINDREDLKSEVRWHDRVEPFHHQVTNLITYCRRLPVTLLADDVGLGKTISAGLIASELIARRRLNKILIVAPKLLGPQWKEELETKFNIPATVAPGKKLLDADPDGDVGAVITTYHSAREYIKRLPADRFQMMILDEAHKLRNLYGVPTPPQVAIRFREVLADRAFKFVLMLTATPIQNRLWDLYSLVDLLTVARGHQNPFGSEGLFARNFIADNRTQARQLKAEAKDQFRSIVYGYMSRVRRADAQLHFPNRKVFRQGVTPTPEEWELIKLIARPIQKLNRLAQIGILQALTSSPDACALQLENMAKKGTFPANVASQFRAIVKSMKMSAKLQGLATLVDKLKRENPKNWRMVVFTQRRETQTTIQAYLESLGVPVGIINGETTGKNQATIAAFKGKPPELNVIVSTEAGSEGVNLQAANVLVNYDLPWNPMIVEQRIGRIQRLGSDHANVLVYSVTLAGTFEDYIVGRLMQKLQMASHAIGDIESLLQASGMADSEEGGSESFEDEILRLVLSSLAGKDVEAATRAAEDSIDRARQALADEEATINEMLGSMDDAAYKGPRSPDLPPQARSMAARDFVFAGLKALGAKLTEEPPDTVICELDGRRERISFVDQPNAETRAILYAPGSQAFDQLITRVTQSGVHYVRDADANPQQRAQAICADWVKSFGGTLRSAKLARVTRAFEGQALLQVRATVAHDSYERLISVDCAGDDHQFVDGIAALDPLPPVINDPKSIGISLDRTSRSVMLDPGIAEFCRFYTERRTEEVHAAGNDPRLSKKLQDDFTPRLQTTITGLRGTVHRILEGQVTYSLDGQSEYTSTLRLAPSTSQIITAPPLVVCAKSGTRAPADAIGECAVSGMRVLRHLLVKSEASDRCALPEHMALCTLSGKRVLASEVEASAVTNKLVLRCLLKSSSLSGQKAEPAHIGRCEFTHVDALLTELAVSDVSGKRYRADQTGASDISGRTGHTSEFVTCALTGRTLLSAEAERCEVTGRLVVPGSLQECSVSHKRVLPSQLAPSDATGRPVLRSLLRTSSLSGRKAEPDKMGRCAFTHADGLLAELSLSQVSGKLFRADQSARSEVSGQVGHISEFIGCSLTGRSMVPAEAEHCAVTGMAAFPGQLQECVVSRCRVIPNELEASSISGRKALKQYLVASSISGVRCLEDEAVLSDAGKCCAKSEAIPCAWSRRETHPDDIRTCDLTRLQVHCSFATRQQQFKLVPIVEMLNGTRRAVDQPQLWPELEQLVSKVAEGNCTIESVQASPDKQQLAVCAEQKKLLGFRVRHIGFLYSIADRAIIGRLAVGKRAQNGWSIDK